VLAQNTGIGTGWPAELVPRLALAAAVPMFMIFFISALAETNRRPSTCRRPNRNWWPGYMVEYSLDALHALFMLGEYANIDPDVRADDDPVPGRLAAAGRHRPFTWVPGIVWFALKIACVFFMFSMVKATSCRATATTS
jgi:NADH-quinone oxidoreductase subunit H